MRCCYVSFRQQSENNGNQRGRGFSLRSLNDWPRIFRSCKQYIRLGIDKNQVSGWRSSICASQVPRFGRDPSGLCVKDREKTRPCEGWTKERTLALSHFQPNPVVGDVIPSLPTLYTRIL